MMRERSKSRQACQAGLVSDLRYRVWRALDEVDEGE